MLSLNKIVLREPKVHLQLVEGFKRSIQRGDKMKLPVVRKITNDKYICEEYNNLVKACKDLGVEELEVEVL